MKQIHKDYQRAFLLEKTKLDRLLDVIHGLLDEHLNTIQIVDAHRGTGKRFVARSDEKLTAFLDLERITCESCASKMRDDSVPSLTA